MTSGAFSAGVLASQSLIITSAQMGTTLNAVHAGSGANGTSNSFTVNPGGLGNFLVEVAGGGNLLPQTAGIPFGIQVTARDQYNNTVSSFKETVTLETTAGNISPASCANFVGGVATLDVTVTEAGTTQTITAVSGSYQGTSNDFTVNPGGLGNFLIEAEGGGSIEAQTAWSPFSIRITARDQYNNIVPAFIGTVSLTTNAGTINPSSIESAAGDSGRHIASVTVTQPGADKTITASSDSYAGTSNTFTVNGGAGDFDQDGDVDGSDLVNLILGNETLDIAAFALNFGR